jgi:spermidine synthase
MSHQFKALAHAAPFLLETADSRSMHFTYLQTQSEMHVDKPDWLSLEYTRLMMGFMLFQPMPEAVLMIGLGGGSLAKFCYRNFPESQITAVEINPDVIQLRDAFDIPPDDDRLSVVLGDGAEFVKTADEKFNTLLVDGYTADGIPSELSTQSFYDDCFSALRPGGVAVFNFDGYDPGYSDKLEKIRRIFGAPSLQVTAASCANIAIFACKGELKLDHLTCITALSNEFRPEVLSPLLPAFNRTRLAYRIQRGYGIYQSLFRSRTPAYGY